TKATESPTTHQPRRRWWQMWQIWGILLVLCSGGVGYGATSMLLELPKTQSCSKVFWPVASASIRLYCAQTSAEKKNVDGLLAAINLVAVLPDNHPLSSEINRNIDRWATSILAIGESEFQSGQLEQAIATAKKIPQGVSAQKLVEQKIADWKSIWSEGEAIYLEVENKLRAADWDGAINSAVRLTDSPNKYWATTKYEESINNINVAQEENASLSKAQIQVTNGRIDDLILAIDRADDIGEKSYTYNQAQKIITEAKGKLMASIEQLIENKDWQELLRVSNKIPSSLKLQKRVKDWQILANAGSSAQLDTVFGIEEAIEEVNKLKKNSEYYPLGQNLIRRWKLEIEDVRHLAKARELARVGTISNFNEAITEARLIPNSNPRYSDAQQEINDWRRQIQVIEDQPILDRARELSYSSNVNAWQRAIAEANLISSNSPLYGEAQDYVRTWRANIERVQDQPILNEADSFANMNNYPAAINTASRIRSGRALYSEAQRKIALWQAEIDGERYLREATELADEGTPEALAQAIRVARQAPARSSVNSQVVIDVNDWAAEILDMARDAADDDSLESAIEIAGLIPSGTTSFSTAQEEIKIWKIQLYPEPELPPSFKLEKLEKERN
ncbi:MAG: chromosome segregation ATPase, partial [Waterburya sp.]